MIVRAAKQEDFAKVIEIEELSFPAPWDYDFLENISNDIFLVFDGEEVCGYLIAGCCHRNVSATILKVAVHPEHRRKGIATNLVHKLVEILQDRKITEIDVIVLEVCKPALLFYKKVGFKTVSIIPQASNNDLCEMKLTIGWDEFLAPGYTVPLVKRVDGADYKGRLPLLPKTLGYLAKSGEQKDQRWHPWQNKGPRMLACHLVGREDVGAECPQTTSYFDLAVTPRSKGSPCNFTRNVPFLVLFLLLLIACNSTEIPLPKSIGSMRLEKVQSGEEARRKIDRLHGKQISLLRGYIGTYVAHNGSGQLWVSEHISEKEATEALEKMAHGMKQGKQQQFWHFRQMMIEQRPVYLAVGMGQAHYFFQKGAKVIWLAVDPALAKEAIRDTVRGMK